MARTASGSSPAANRPASPTRSDQGRRVQQRECRSWVTCSQAPAGSVVAHASAERVPCCGSPAPHADRLFARPTGWVRLISAPSSDHPLAQEMRCLMPTVYQGPRCAGSGRAMRRPRVVGGTGHNGCCDVPSSGQAVLATTRWCCCPRHWRGRPDHHHRPGAGRIRAVARGYAAPPRSTVAAGPFSATSTCSSWRGARLHSITRWRGIDLSGVAAGRRLTR